MASARIVKPSSAPATLSLQGAGTGRKPGVSANRSVRRVEDAWLRRSFRSGGDSGGSGEPEPKELLGGTDNAGVLAVATG